MKEVAGFKMENQVHMFNYMFFRKKENQGKYYVHNLNNLTNIIFKHSTKAACSISINFIWLPVTTIPGHAQKITDFTTVHDLWLNVALHLIITYNYSL